MVAISEQHLRRRLGGDSMCFCAMKKDLWDVGTNLFDNSWYSWMGIAVEFGGVDVWKIKGSHTG